MSWGRFRKSIVYSRRDIHDVYNGQVRRGICTPREHPVVFAFTGENGKQFGYKDRWEGSVFHYYGEWPVGNGDMEFKGGNKALRDHLKNRKDLLLFEMLPKGKGQVRFLGQFECRGWKLETISDMSGNERTAIVFELVELEPMQMAS
jgi:5-methylcytosine-specific restriction protein A